jgi:hypothetical protein
MNAKSKNSSNRYGLGSAVILLLLATVGCSRSSVQAAAPAMPATQLRRLLDA